MLERVQCRYSEKMLQENPCYKIVISKMSVEPKFSPLPGGRLFAFAIALLFFRVAIYDFSVDEKLRKERPKASLLNMASVNAEILSLS